jgi:hypothetical protein
LSEIILIQPDVVYNEKVTLTWSYILDKPEAFVKYVLKKSINEDMSEAEIVTEITDLSITEYIDTTITHNNFYYIIEVHSTELAFQGNKLDFDFEDANQFIYDSNKLEFYNGIVHMKSLPAVIETIESNEMIFDSNYLEIVNGKVQLKAIE